MSSAVVEGKSIIGEVMKGTVKFFSKDKGFGYIVADSGVEHFVGVKEVVGAILPSNGDIVTFESRKGKKGLVAAKVEILETARNTYQRQDDRIACPSCKKRMYPKLIHDRSYFGNPRPRKSLCPFCGSTVKDFSACFIATSVYGDFDAPEVFFYRHYRDNVLKSSFLGRCFIRTYYMLAPAVVVILEKCPWLSRAIRKKLDSIIRKEAY